MLIHLTWLPVKQHVTNGHGYARLSFQLEQVTHFHFKNRVVTLGGGMIFTKL